MNSSVPVAGTFSKDSIFWGKNFPVRYLVEGKAQYVKANNGRWYLDWVSGLGANLLGYESRYSDYGFYHYVMNAVRKGLSFSFPTEYEYISAEKLVNLLNKYILHWNNTELQVRWTLSGSDACSTAIRLAKAVKKGVVVSYGYHGMGSEFIAATPPAHGLYDITPVVDLKWDALPRSGDEVSAVIIEVPPVVERLSYFSQLRKWCDEHNVLLIVDEVVTGLRYARGGACELFGIEPDIVCMGKSLANGLPIGATIARKELMDRFNPNVLEHNDPVFISSTNVGNMASMAAANFVLDYVENEDYLTHIDAIGFRLKNGLTAAGFNVIGNSARNLIVWESDGHKGYVIDRFEKEGILLNRPNFPNMAHTMENVEQTVEAAKIIQDDWKNLSTGDVEYWNNNAPLVLFRGR